MDTAKASRFVDTLWNDSIVPHLVEYIRIPNKSPAFDPQWREHGHMARAVALVEGWCRANAPAGSTVEVLQQGERTPLILVDVPGDGEGCVLLYGHLDKQPEMSGWEPGLGPWTPVLRDGKLYGRGGADDGYAAFAAIGALLALADQHLPHARCIVVIEACEESGSYDLPHYIDTLAPRIGRPDLVVCLDSGCGNYDQLWSTTSLRGLAAGTLRATVLTEGVHSGDASGVVASSFRVLRQLLDRLEDASTGRILPGFLHVEIPGQRRTQAAAMTGALGTAVYDKFPFVAGMRPMAEDLVDLALNRTWRPALSITGADGLPQLADAGNVLRPTTALKLSLRLPPTLDAAQATRRLQDLLEKDPPCGAQVQFAPDEPADGWNAPPVSRWLETSLDAASQAFFGRGAMHLGEGGTIPFMGMLGEKFPEAQFVITGVLGPHSNAHGPNEFLHLATARRLTGCIAKVLADHHAGRA